MPEVETAYTTLLAQFGEPEFVLSDRGSEFNFLPDDRLRTSAEHPEGNSKLERFHKELIKISRVHGLPPMHAVRYLQTDEKRSLFVMEEGIRAERWSMWIRLLHRCVVRLLRVTSPCSSASQQE